jgi:hypothetical protein
MIVFWWDWDFNSGLYACKADALLLQPHLQPILHFALVILVMESLKLFAGAGLKP